MLSDAIEYPMEGEGGLQRLVVGSVVTFVASVLLLPGILLAGYSVAVCRGVLEGRTEPPAFEDWGALVTDGLSAVAITLLYWVPGLLLGGIGLVAWVLLLAGPVGGASLGGTTVGLLAATGTLLGFGYALLVGYVLPAAIVNYARTGELRAAWDLGTLRAIVADGAYAKAWVAGTVVLFAFGSAGSTLVWVLVGFPVLFLGQVVATYAFTRGTLDALGIDPGQPDEAVADTDRTRGGVADPSEYIGRLGAQGDDGAADAGVDRTPGAVGSGSGTAGVPAAEVQPGEAAGGGASERALEDVAGIGPGTAQTLRAAGLESVADLRAATRAELAAVEGIGAGAADRIKGDVGDG